MFVRFIATAILLVLFSEAAWADDAVLCVQERLNALGFDAGTADGQIGRRTVNASADFAREYRLTEKLPRLKADVAAEWCAALTALPVLAGTEIKVDQRIPKDEVSGWADLRRAPSTLYKPWAVRLVNDRARTGDTSVRLEVRNGDCDPARGGTIDWDDCKVGAERTEIVANCTAVKLGTPYEYGWSAWYDTSWPSMTGLDGSRYTVLGQLKQEVAADARGGRSNTELFQIVHNPGGLFVRQYSPDFSSTNPDNPFGLDDVLVLPEAEFRNKWIDYRVEAIWSDKDDGYLSVYVNGERVYEFFGRTVVSKGKICHQNGIYRDARWRDDQPMIAWFDDYFTGPGKEEEGSAADESVACVQERLFELGYNTGVADGRFGRRVIAASEKYARLTDSTLPSLTVETAGQWCEALPKPNGVRLAAGDTLPAEVADGELVIQMDRNGSARLVEDRVREGTQAAQLQLSTECTSKAQCGNEISSVTISGWCGAHGKAYSHSWSTYFDNAWPRNYTGSDTVVASFTGPDHALFEIVNHSAGLRFYHYSKAFPLSGQELADYKTKLQQNGIRPQVEMRPFGDYGYAEMNLLPEDRLRGQWHDLKLDAKWTTGKDGYLTLWLGERKVYHFEGATMGAKGKLCPTYQLYRYEPWPGEPMIAWFDQIATKPAG